MTFSYSGNPNKSEKDAVRFIIQDTDPNNQLVQDEEIEYLLNENKNVLLVGARIADILAGRFSQKASVTIGDYSESFSDLSSKYLDLGNKLRLEANKRVRAYAGGISKEDRKRDRKDKDLIQPYFTRGGMDNVKD